MDKARDTYLNSDLLAEMAGRLKYASRPLEELLGKIEEPQPKPWSYPSHPFDAQAAHYGMKGFEFKALQEAALIEVHHNVILQELYRKFLMAAQLICNDAVEKARAYETKVAQEKQTSDFAYKQRKSSYDQNQRKITKTWTEIRETIRTRWARIGRSIATMVERDAAFGSMDPRDQCFLDLLGGRGIVESDCHPDINQRRVLGINWDAYSALSIEDINEIINDLNNSPAGRFIKEPTVTKLL